MTLRVLEGPASRLPATVSALRERLGLAEAASDAALEAVLVAVSRAFCGIDGLDREWWLQTYEEHVTGTDEPSLRLSRWPVDSATVRQGSALVDPESFQIHGPRRDVLYRPGGRWPVGRLEITYAAGWLSPAVPDPAADLPVLPEDIQAAAVIAAAQWHRGDVDVPAGVTLERDPTGATSYRPEGVDPLPRVARRVLRSYR